MEKTAKDVCETYCIHAEKVAKLQGNLPDLSQLAKLFKVLGDETRTKILYILAKEEMCVCDIAAILGSTVSNVSHHLRLLRSASLVRCRREGKVVYYALDDRHVMNLFTEGLEHVQHLNKI
ncbi:DNA-binding transcriptional ArsR family regulator [Desulfohalotomaculum tongense]|uniref:ArsR/SmtB family transcription factor n=1 Tax=Desulforadius tongensis TaxID=1216062 RepID=UPI0019597FF8|nr:metalloregulator ArsR/SmtB family transcription factor [Desulforadius tongensis]MBM7856005.1 DNA-binding transcriptional ArsR family regulator [Desulforadius tongensis]